MKYIDNWFWGRYTLNAYNGCSIGCIYCDSRSSRYHLPIDFENNIVVKENIPDLLEEQLKRTRALPDIVVMSGASDPYQPGEKKFEITKKCLEILSRNKYPVHIITKSKLVERDLELLDKIGEQTWCAVSVTITTINADKARFLEERAVSPERRLQILEKIADYPNIRGGVTMSPLIPFYEDDPSEILELIQAIKKTGADYILGSIGLTMNDTQGIWFLNRIKRKYPELIPKYEEIFEFEYKKNKYDGRKIPIPTYFESLKFSVETMIESVGLKTRIDRYIPKDYRKNNYIISEKMFKLGMKYSYGDKSRNELEWTARNIQNLKESVLDILVKRESVEGITKRMIEQIKNIIGEEGLLSEFSSIDEWF